MDIADWRKKIDELDQKLVQLLNERATAAREIGHLKRHTQLPIYEPQREREIFENVRSNNHGPLPDRDLVQVYERIIDVMRKIQREEINGAASTSPPARTEIEAGADE
jgi:chorismate mutase